GIIGGQDATPGSWPWHALVVAYGPYGYKQCGGSLITNQWVLTAARCSPLPHIFKLKQQVIFYSVGRYNQSVKETICHPAFSFYCWTYENDICLLKLSAPVNFTDYIQPICLASEKSTFHNGTSSWVTGFGYDDSNSFSLQLGYRFSNILQEVNVPILGNNECRYITETDHLLKVTDLSLQFSINFSSQGDEREPLVIKAGSLWVQSGVQSYSYGCGGLSIYTRVSQYQKWISDTVTGTPPEECVTSEVWREVILDLNAGLAGLLRMWTAFIIKTGKQKMRRLAGRLAELKTYTEDDKTRN
uniref:Peptidase S1 domain-containing protein n=1 Tax=Oreochromis aureus TaxID=47969 RepID=A0A668SW05_OREAU